MTAVVSDILSGQSMQLENKVLILVSEGVSFTTILKTIEPFQQ